MYTKANLLLSTGLVTQAAYDKCVGTMKLHEYGQGIYLWDQAGPQGLYGRT